MLKDLALCRKHWYARILMAIKKRTTKPVSPAFKALRAELRTANAKGEDPARAVYKAMSTEAKTAFIRSRGA